MRRWAGLPRHRRLAEVTRWKAKATAAVDAIADRDGREIIEGDLATLP
ncbi:MAG: hypothetical protein ABJC39_05570 [Chloroflexota bacterium]